MWCQIHVEWNIKGIRTHGLNGESFNWLVVDDGNTYIIAGIEIVPTKGFKTSLNIRSRSFEDALVTTEKELFVNSLLKF